MASHSQSTGLTPREIAQQHRQQELRKERTRRAVIGGAILAALAAIVLVVALLFKKNAKDATPDTKGPAPAYGNAFGGVVLIKGGTLKKAGGLTVDASTVGPKADANSTKNPSGLTTTKKGEPGQVVIYLDMLCPYCKKFEEIYGKTILEMVEQGKITAEYRVISILDMPTNNNYATRAGGAVLSVADRYPEKFSAAMKALFDNQPSEQFGGDDKLIKDILKDAGIPSDINGMIDNKDFRPYVKFATALSQNDNVRGTPSIYVEGKKWDSTVDKDFKKFLDETLAARK